MDNIIGRANSKVSITTETEREANNRSWPNNRRRIIIFDEDGRVAFLDLDKTERLRLREVLDEISPDDRWS